MRPFFIVGFVGLALMCAPTPSRADSPIELIIKAIKEVPNLWRWGSGGGSHGNRSAQTISESDKSSGTSAPSKGKAIRETTRDSVKSAKDALRSPEEEKEVKAKTSAEWTDAMEAARKRGEDEIMQGSVQAGFRSGRADFPVANRDEPRQ